MRSDWRNLTIFWCGNTLEPTEYARTNGFVIVTKDADYLTIGARLGHPPKVVRIGLGNCPTAVVADLLRVRRDELLRFSQDDHGAFIELR